MPGIDERTLLRLVHDGCDSEMVRYRLRYAEGDSVLKYLRPLVGLERAHARYLPTQKSGRWSTKEPPWPNFSNDCINPTCELQGTDHRVGAAKMCWSLRDIVVPDPGYMFIHFDYEAIEAKLAAGYSGDEEDLDLFARGADIHTWTLCSMFGLPKPKNVMNPYKAPEDADWRAATGLQVKDTWQRTGAKTCRFSLAYGSDERAIFQAKSIDQLAREAGLDRKGIEDMARRYLDSKPKLTAWKRRMWRHIIDKQEVRTPLGRRKRLFVSAEERAQFLKTGRATVSCREGTNHMAQAQVAGMLNRTIIAIKARWPESRLAMNLHDGFVGVFPETTKVWPDIRELVERDWELFDGVKIKSTAEFEIVYSDGRHEALR